MSTATDYREVDLLDLAAAVDESTQAAFLRVVESIPARRVFTVNDIRERLVAAGVPEKDRGGLFHLAKTLGLIEPVTVSAWGRDYAVREPSTGASARRATVRVYRRLGRDTDGGE
ncbi:hypothetical protein ACTHAM_002382 [Cellulomonas soli]